MSDKVFALDIGTRSVVGLLMEKIGSDYQVLDFCVKEHTERSMLDGQIHNIVAVSDIIQSVKLTLEQNNNCSLDKVCVAAAGRALKTKRICATKDISLQPVLTEEDISFLELEAVQKVQKELALEELNKKTVDYYCVGYSVLYYRLDGEEIGSLIEQRGETAEVEIIATFLPKVVVESLISALERAGLSLEALTLEPIATIHVLIPPSMRRLNVALVDIGAGTSDIALTSEGTITAYGMVSKAGDEITEAISDQYILDFNKAETVKRDITNHKKATVEDILGFEQEITYEELVEGILPAIDSLASSIANEILELNGKSPQAVMLVGGGSQTPELAKRVAVKLNLPANRVAIRGVDAIPQLANKDMVPLGPEFITPIGIGMTARQNPIHYVSIHVNNRPVRLFEMKNLTIADGLIAAGIDIKKYYGRPGAAYFITYNGKSVTLPGSFGTPPVLMLNGEEASLDQIIKSGDTIIVEQGKDGREPSITCEELIGELKQAIIYLNGKAYPIQPLLKVNQSTKQMNYVLQDGDNIEFQEQLTLQDFLKLNGLSYELEQPFTIWIDDEQLVLSEYGRSLYKNGRVAKSTDILRDMDQLETTSEEKPKLEEVLLKLQIPLKKELFIRYNNQPLTLTKELVTITRNGEKLNFSDRIHDGDKLQMQKRKNEPFIFQDIFRFISLDLNNITSKVELKKNGQPASFFDELQSNDHIEIVMN
ncbi:cell division protein FtsA [Gracilibacillus halotolerans]|uniref:Cell division protein FtsA n=1 Tax=Gracilibacillus halotolerans TaxID=74386 RepID=A0A841RLM2_9BACI|nr:pilus assembly protein PilM [Gracilibacillus halotolerans]MBB6513671.1 cell division protein FtsA [Gracilibacillus halotolerans]